MSQSTTHNPTAGTPRIAVLTGYWSTNIGNAFFQIGAQHVLQEALRPIAPNAHVFLIGDQPGYLNVEMGNPANSLDYAAHLDVDAIVVMGPYIRPEMEKITADMLRAQHKKGTKIIVLAAGMMQYDKDTIAMSRRLMAECPPAIYTTRDTETFEAMGDLADHAYDGVDVATFVTDVFPAIPTDLPPYMVMNFDQIPEPAIGPGSEFPGGGVDRSFEFEGQTWQIRQPKRRTELSYKHRAYPFLDALLFRDPGPKTLGGRTVVRTDHRYNPYLIKKNYRGHCSYVGDIPHTYLNIYAHSELTISNRVHACVATVAYGNPAMLFTRSPRAYLLKRLGLKTIKDEPNRVDLAWLRKEKTALTHWLREKLADVLDLGPVPASAKADANADAQNTRNAHTSDAQPANAGS